MNEQLDRWTGKFGDDYTDRNQYDPASRREIFNDILPDDALTILEVGCNMGNNVETLNELDFDALGVEPNEHAVKKGLNRGRLIVLGDAAHLPFPDASFDIVFTAGVLMHIRDYETAMEEIWRVTKKYALAIEYEGTEEIRYRGNQDMLWKRPDYKYPGNLIATEQLGKEFDHSRYWLYEKV